MGLVGMTEAGRRLGIEGNSARRALQAAGVPLVEITPRAYAVEESHLATFIKTRGDYGGKGRPPGAKNKPKSGERRHI